MDRGDLLHHRRVDGEAARGVDDQHVVVMPACPVERLPELILRRRGSGGVLQQKKLALDAQQLGTHLFPTTGLLP